MARRVDVADAIKALVAAALAPTPAIGMDADEAKPEAVGPDGLAIIRSGDPGTPDIDLSPLTYHYSHAFPVELAAYQGPGVTYQRALSNMAARIGAAIEANRTLGGLCNWLEADAPTDGETEMRGATTLGWADFNIIASYSTPNPLS